MPRFDAHNSVCRIYAKRAGVLSVVGHDLELGVREYTIDLADSGLRIDATFAAASVYVIDAVDGGRVRPGALSAHDKASIDHNVANDVLEAAAFPTIEFHSDTVELRPAGDHLVQGRLHLHGRERPLRFGVSRSGDQLAVEVVVHQPDFGIRPFRAFAGALKIQHDVRVRISLAFTPAPP